MEAFAAARGAGSRAAPVPRCPLRPPRPHACVSACLLQREKHKLNPSRAPQISVRKVRTRKDEWERRKMGIEFMSDARTPAPAGGPEEDAAPRGFVVLLSPWPASGRPPRFARGRPALCWPRGLQPGPGAGLSPTNATHRAVRPCVPGPGARSAGPSWAPCPLSTNTRSPFLPESHPRPEEAGGPGPGPAPFLFPLTAFLPGDSCCSLSQSRCLFCASRSCGPVHLPCRSS